MVLDVLNKMVQYHARKIQIAILMDIMSVLIRLPILHAFVSSPAIPPNVKIILAGQIVHVALQVSTLCYYILFFCQHIWGGAATAAPVGLL